jgi:hypothetical protein
MALILIKIFNILVALKITPLMEKGIKEHLIKNISLKEFI